MTAALASVEDLADVWRPLTDEEIPRAENLIVKASALLRQKTQQTIDDRIALFATEPGNHRAVDPVAAATVVATIVKRFIDNVEGAASKSETAGPYARQISYALRGNGEVRGEMVVTDQDLASLSSGTVPQIGRVTLGVPPTFIRHRRHGGYWGNWPCAPESVGFDPGGTW